MPWSLVFLAFCATISFYCAPYSLAGNNETDRLALLEIKAKITHDPLGITSSWNESLHHCKWLGVSCGHKHKRVTALDLQSSDLTGLLSPYLGNLTFLQELYLPNNSFIGPIPPEIGRLRRLHYLYLYNNSLGGKIPSNISGCYSLIELGLGNSELVGGIPPELGSLSNLQFLSLNFNDLGGTIPSSLGNLSSLRTLGLVRANLVGEIPDTLGKLKKLTTLALSMNELSGKIPPSIFNLSFISVLDLGENHLEGSLPLDLGIMFPYLKVLALSSNLFVGSIPASISNSSNLEVFQLASNNFRGQVPSLDRLSSLNNLLLYENFLGNGQKTDLDFVYSLSNSTMLTSFAIFQNNFQGVFPQVICSFSMLTKLAISANKISGPIPTCIGNLVELVILAAERCQLSGIVPMSIGKLKSLYYLDLGNNQLTGPLPTAIGNLTQLAHLFLFRNNLEGQIPSSIGYCRNLLELDLSYNNLSGRIPSEMFSLSSLSIILDLSYNQLVGPLPEEFGSLIHLGVLNLSQNMLSGEIPTTLGASVSLEILNMGGNFFQGAIPSMLTALIGLRELNLSNNNLTGEVPNSLVKMRVQKLDLSNNDLEGEVPIGGIFNNATIISLSGNHRLCGGVPELRLPKCNFGKSKRRKIDHRKRLILIGIFSVLSAVILLLAFASLYVLYCRKRRKELPTFDAQDSRNTLSNLSYQSILKATNGFASENLLGSGTFGVVYRGTFDEGRTTVAIKKFSLEHQGASKSFVVECEVLRNIRHRNLVKVITACSGIDYQGNDFKCLVYEYMGNGSLEDWLHPQNSSSVEGTSYTPTKLSFIQRLDVAVDVASALDYLHYGCGASVVHCDLKPSNVLLDDDMVAHVGDFGLAKFLQVPIASSRAIQSSSVGVRGTVGYAPPEYGLGNEISKHGDVYSFGILLLEMYTGKRPTDDMFKESSSLHSFVKTALPERVVDVLDSTLVTDMIGDGNSQIMLEALIVLLDIAVSCSVELPQERPDMKYVAAKLSSIRNKIVGNHLRQQRRSPPGDIYSSRQG